MCDHRPPESVIFPLLRSYNECGSTTMAAASALVISRWRVQVVGKEPCWGNGRLRNNRHIWINDRSFRTWPHFIGICGYKLLNKVCSQRLPSRPDQARAGYTSDGNVSLCDVPKAMFGALSKMAVTRCSSLSSYVIHAVLSAQDNCRRSTII